MVSVELFAPVTVVGLKEHVAPAGRPEEQATLTAELKPFTGVRETVDATEAPAETVTGDVAEIEKSGTVPACTVRLNTVVWFTDPEVPVIVTL
jgi:hypothetical protein